MTGANETDVLRAIVGRLEMEVRTAHAFLAMAIMSQGGVLEVTEDDADSVPNDFEVKVTRNDKVATFEVISGEEAESFRESQAKANPIVVNQDGAATGSLREAGE